MRGWPENDEPANFSDIVESLRDAFRFGATWRRKNAEQDIPWRGLGLSERMLASCLDVSEQLTAEQVRRSHDDQGRDFVTTILGIAIQLGIEQGRRCERKDLKTRLDTIRLGLNIACETFEETFPEAARPSEQRRAEDGG